MSKTRKTDRIYMPVMQIYIQASALINHPHNFMLMLSVRPAGHSFRTYFSRAGFRGHALPTASPFPFDGETVVR